MDLAAATAVLAATAATGLWEGAALYITVATVPHYSDPEEPTGELLADWRRFFPPALALQARLALLGIATSSLAAWANKGTVQVALPYAIAGAAQAVVVAYTLAKIMPVNHQLLPVGQVEKRGEATIRGLLKQWGHMHGRRTVLGGVAFGATLYGLHALLMRK